MTTPSLLSFEQILDNFLGVNGTPLTAHVGDVGGGTWVRRSDTGGNTPSAGTALALLNGRARAGGRGDDANDGLFNTAAPTSADHYVEVTYQFNTVPSFYQMQVVTRGSGGHQMYGVGGTKWVWGYLDNNVTSYINGYTTQSTHGPGVTITTGAHRLRLEVQGVVGKLYWDDVLLCTHNAVGAGGVGSFPGIVFDNYDMAAVADVEIEKFTIGPLPYGSAGPPPSNFWTDFIKSTETLP